VIAESVRYLRGTISRDTIAGEITYPVIRKKPSPTKGSGKKKRKKFHKKEDFKIIGVQSSLKTV